uniref:Protein MAK16 homolog n=1 Tax=Hirondellea gigas TaxID=1518452 RepID=A0A6A7G7T7_9CRUS
MQHDEVIWQVINQGHCSFKSKQIGGKTFCRNGYNVTGLCNRSSCPLANSRYATIVERQGKVYLYMKTIERAHSPKNLWERIKLPKNYAEALKLIDEHLIYWPNFLRHKCKQRLTKITQYLIRMRKLKLKTRPITVRINKKVERRERKREEKAKVAAKLTASIKKELIDRLHSNNFGGIVNVPMKMYEDILDVNEDKESEDDEEESEEEFEGEIEYVEDSDIESEDDIEEVEFEYEYERENSGFSSQQRTKKRQLEDDSESEIDEMESETSIDQSKRRNITIGYDNS